MLLPVTTTKQPAQQLFEATGGFTKVRCFAFPGGICVFVSLATYVTGVQYLMLFDLSLNHALTANQLFVDIIPSAGETTGWC